MQKESPLSARPEYAQAIGMLSIEIARLERLLANLLGAILDIDADTAEAIYLTPKATIPRVELLENVAEARLYDRPRVLAEVLGIAKRSRTIFGKRHNLIHSYWIIGPVTYDVLTFPLTGKRTKPHRTISIKDIERLTEETRNLIIDSVKLVSPVQKTIRPTTR